MPQLVRKRPFAYPGYSEQARTNMDFGDPDALELDELQDKDLSDLAKEYEAGAPVTKALWKPKKFKSPIDMADNFEKDYGEIDADYERSFGPVDSDEKYQSYLKWLKQGN